MSKSIHKGELRSWVSYSKYFSCLFSALSMKSLDEEFFSVCEILCNSSQVHGKYMHTVSHLVIQ